MLDNLDRLRAEHAEILTTVAELNRLLQPSTVRKKAPLIQGLVAELTRRTLAHLLLEDRCLYQEMLISPHDETRAIAQQQVIRMGNMAEQLRNYVQSWHSRDCITSSPEKFCEESQHILKSLETRINQEERALYPKAEALT